MISEETVEPGLERFPDILSWMPDGVWLYVIAAFLILFIWLVYPIAFIAGVTLLVLFATS